MSFDTRLKVKVSNESSWPTDQPRIAAKSPWPSGWGPAASDCKGWNLTKGSPREWLSGNVVETKVVGGDKNSCFKLFLDVHDHLGEVQAPRTPRSGTWSRGVPGIDFLAMLLKEKLLGMIKVVVLSFFRTSMAIWVRSSHLGLQGLGPDQGESQGLTFWQCCWNKSCWGWW